MATGYNANQTYISEYVNVTSPRETVVNQIYSMSTGYDGTNIYFKENDDTYTEAIDGIIKKPSSSTVFAIGTNPNGSSQELGSSESRFNLEVYSVRIYNRCLTEEEINYNYQIDKSRYGI